MAKDKFAAKNRAICNAAKRLNMAPRNVAAAVEPFLQTIKNVMAAGEFDSFRIESFGVFKVKETAVKTINEARGNELISNRGWKYPNKAGDKTD